MTDPAPRVEYLSLEDLLDLVNALGVGPVRDLGLLDSACHRPQASFFGLDAYPTLRAKAAALMQSLACNHALVDGNKRLALLATVVFLRINGYTLDLTDDEAFDLTLSVAAGHLDPDGIQERLRPASRDLWPGVLNHLRRRSARSRRQAQRRHGGVSSPRSSRS